MWLTAAVLSFGLLGADPQGAAPQPEVKPEAKADAQPEAKAPAKEAAPNRVRAMGPRHVQPRHHAHQENGRIWVSRPFIGPGPSHPVLNCENPGPAAYGAHEGDRSRVVVRVGQQLITISPWERIGTEGLHWLERERVAWLRANGYCGGVRTFRNDAFAPAHHPAQPMHAPPHAGGGMMEEDFLTVQPALHQLHIQPRATIRLPADAPRFRGRMQVWRPAYSPTVRASYSVCWERPGVSTVRGEASDGSVIRVLPLAEQTVTAAKVAGTQVASAVK